MTRLLFSTLAFMAACSFDVNVKGIPKTIQVVAPQLPNAPPLEPDADQPAPLEPDHEDGGTDE